MGRGIILKSMSLTDHLEDLRKMVIRIFIILFVAFFGSYFFGDKISEVLLAPLREVLVSELGAKVVYLGLLDKVISQLQIAFWSAAVFSSPLWFYEVWRFIRPGLHDHEVRAIRPFLFVGFIFFILGVLFGYCLVFPMTFKILMNFGVGNVTATIGLKDYLTLSSKVLFFFGIIFQLPNVLLILGFMGLVTKYSLRSMRRYIYVGFAVLAAALTPPDIISMTALWVPLCLLFEAGIWAVAFIVHPYLERRTESE